MYCPCAPERAVVVAQARPHSILPIYEDSLVKREVTSVDEPTVLRALDDGRRAMLEVRRQVGNRHPVAKGASVMQEAFPVRTPDGRVVAAVTIETNLIEHERHRRRNRAYQRALRLFQESVLAGELRGATDLGPFTEHDGLVVLDADGNIEYCLLYTSPSPRD